MKLDADKILAESANSDLKERTHMARQTLKKIKTDINKNKVSAEEGYACLRKVVAAINRQNIENGRFEAALELSQEALKMFESEALRVTVFLSLENMGLERQAKAALEEGLKAFPNNPTLNKSKKKYDDLETSHSREQLLGNVQPTNRAPSPVQTSPSFPIFTPPMTGMPNFDPNQLSMFENMDDAQLESMFNMTKGMNVKDQFSKVHGRQISDEEARRMESMMTPANFKMALNMMKANPNLMRQAQTEMGRMQANQPPVNTSFAQPMRQDTPVTPPTNFPAPQFNPQTMPQMNPNMPQMNPNAILENKDSIKMVLKMVKDNPRMICDMMANMGAGDKLSALQRMSDKQLKILATMLYYIAFVSLEGVAFFRKYKGQILIFLTAVVVYRYIL